ncbi:M4 family metallopeptidase [Streptomyces orinoci]|uniref:Neutral metalloproteinase n=1 Tax=Streptomyces orinoci TaxID=67339 RepID=A0ABV3K4R5_STRON|nr:M4 family metallopeptidase [Streptomyces orinoci]
MRKSRIARSGARRPAVATGAAAVAAALLAGGFTAVPAQAATGTDDPAKALHLGPKEKLVPQGTITDADGTVHTRYERTYDGLPVIGGDLVVQQTRDGRVQDVDKATEAPIKVPTTKAKVTPPAARRSAESLAPSAAGGGSPIVQDQAPRKVIWAAGGKPVLAYETVIGGTQPGGAPSELHVVTDATTGRKLADWQAVETGEGNSMYSGRVKVGSVKIGGQWVLRDQDRGNMQVFNMRGGLDEDSAPAFRNAKDVWGNGKPTIAQTAAVDAEYGAAVAWDFYKKVLHRNGIKGNGKAPKLYVHYDNNQANAFWLDSCFCMHYGDGLDNKTPVTSIDIAAHEMTHGVTSATAKLRYTNSESGGLNEATSDILGTAVEFYAKNPKNPGNYLIGEQVNLLGNGQPLRYMDRPSRDAEANRAEGWPPSADYWKPGIGKEDMHFSSGIGNHFFYLLAEGSGKKTINGVHYDSPTYDHKPVTGIGRDAAVKIWYKALTEHMTSTTDYHGARAATLKAARDLYGTKSKQYKAVQRAWDGVNVN